MNRGIGIIVNQLDFLQTTLESIYGMDGIGDWNTYLYFNGSLTTQEYAETINTISCYPTTKAAFSPKHLGTLENYLRGIRDLFYIEKCDLILVTEAGVILKRETLTFLQDFVKQDAFFYCLCPGPTSPFSYLPTFNSLVWAMERECFEALDHWLKLRSYIPPTDRPLNEVFSLFLERTGAKAKMGTESYGTLLKDLLCI
jgi:hypothetical protein